MLAASTDEVPIKDLHVRGERWTWPHQFVYLRRRPGLVLAVAVACLFVVAAVHPGLLVRSDPFEASAEHAFAAPSLAHLLGTDENGRDELARIAYGARLSLLIGLGATALGLAVGTALGLLAGLGPRCLDAALMRLVDVLIAVPDILLALVIITIWGQGMTNIIVAVGLAQVPRVARLVRAQSHVVRRAPYVEAARALGRSRSAVVSAHVLPNAIAPALVLTPIDIGHSIAGAAALSFLGLGSPPPEPEWGAMLAIGRYYLSNAGWLTVAPVVVIGGTVLSLTALGRFATQWSEGRIR
jgi:peptide/nickel transport system permease protein